MRRSGSPSVGIPATILLSKVVPRLALAVSDCSVSPRPPPNRPRYGRSARPLPCANAGVVTNSAASPTHPNRINFEVIAVCLRDDDGVAWSQHDVLLQVLPLRHVLV